MAGGEGQYTLQTYFVITSQVKRGVVYSFRYRAINAVGLGEWSDVALVRAATMPSAPPTPYYISSTSTSIKLGFTKTDDNQGSKITHYSLMRDSGDLSSEITTQETDYNGQDLSYTVSSLESGLVYRFTYHAHNEFGVSEGSHVLTLAASSLPLAPTDVTINWEGSSSTELLVEWKNPLTLPAKLITGYEILVVKKYSDYSFTVDVQENNNLSYLLTGLEHGLLYQLQVYAVNFNGRSLQPSTLVEYYVCTKP